MDLNELSGLLEEKGLGASDALGFAFVCEEYHNALVLLQRYDERKDDIAHKSAGGVVYYLKENDMQAAIEGARAHLESKGENAGNFGVARPGCNVYDAMQNIRQVIFGEELYPKIEDKAAHLFYFIIKNHYFVDGNKRMASLFLLWFLEINDMLKTDKNERLLPYNVVFALAVYTAESDASEKDSVVKFLSFTIKTYFYIQITSAEEEI